MATSQRSGRYWHDRHREALDRAARASGAEIHHFYLELAHHYRVMAQLVEDGEPRDAAPLDQA